VGRPRWCRRRGGGEGREGAECLAEVRRDVEDLVRALMSIGSTPRDVIAILQNLRAAGALDAVLEVI
jgi:Flagellar basal-body P-ring protein